jgi:hypothetical protein
VAAAVVVAVVVRPGAAPAGPQAAAPTTTAQHIPTIPDPATADPCSLLDIASVQGFGVVSLERDNSRFASCRADIEPPGGGSIGFFVSFENEVEARSVSGGTRGEEAGLTVIRYEPGAEVCEHRILLADGNSVELYTRTYEDPTGGTDECAINDAGRTAVISRLVRQGIGERPPLHETSPLAAIPACSLLTSEEVAAGVANPAPPRPRFAGWGCDWTSLTGGGTVALSYYRGFVLGDVDGTPADFAGHPGRVLARPGNCWVQFVQRAYTAGGSNRNETVWVTYWGNGSDEQLCQHARTLATAAASRLPPPS